MIVEKNTDVQGGFSPPTGDEMAKIEQQGANVLESYAKCIACNDHGSNCKGPKLAALRTINNVREYHRRLKNSRGITLKEIYPYTEKFVSNATVKEYFAHGEKDFRWTTVSLIDNALTTICAKNAGVSPEDVPPCPATSTEIKAKETESVRKFAEAEGRCAELLEELKKEKDKRIARVDAVRKEEHNKIEYLKQLAEQRMRVIQRKEKHITIMAAIIGVLVVALVAMALFV